MNENIEMFTYDDGDYYFRNCYIVDDVTMWCGRSIGECKVIVDRVREFTYSLTCEECVELCDNLQGM